MKARLLFVPVSLFLCLQTLHAQQPTYLGQLPKWERIQAEIKGLAAKLLQMINKQ